jgi:hypothetical protein
MKYLVVKFIPDLVADETINVGVVAVNNDNQVKSKFTKNWVRVGAFVLNPEKVDLILIPWLNEIEKCKDSDSLLKLITASKSDYSPIRFSEFRGTTETDVDKFLEDISPHFF